MRRELADIADFGMGRTRVALDAGDVYFYYMHPVIYFYVAGSGALPV
jgi:hypothetical protein